FSNTLATEGPCGQFKLEERETRQLVSAFHNNPDFLRKCADAATHTQLLWDKISRHLDSEDTWIYQAEIKPNYMEVLGVGRIIFRNCLFILTPVSRK
ncbi:hypothetical protein CRM22_001550, partial [Opisthorchis felineus]